MIEIDDAQIEEVSGAGPASDAAALFVSLTSLGIAVANDYGYKAHDLVAQYGGSAVSALNNGYNTFAKFSAHHALPSQLH